jgi:two-component system, cell cycle response regulator DivK
MPRVSRSTVLLVQQARDDSGRMYAEFLRHHRFVTIVATDVGEALKLAPEADVVVTGILLSGDVDGIELISRLRADPRTAHMPIVVVTACAWPSARRRAEAAGCNAFLTKPCLPETLLHEVQRALAASKVRRARPRASTGNAEVPASGVSKRRPKQPA